MFSAHVTCRTLVHQTDLEPCALAGTCRICSWEGLSHGLAAHILSCPGVLWTVRVWRLKVLKPQEAWQSWISELCWSMELMGEFIAMLKAISLAILLGTPVTSMRPDPTHQK